MALTIPEILNNKKALKRAVELFEEGLTTQDVATILTKEGLGSPAIGKDLRKALIERGLVDESKLIVYGTRYTGEQIQQFDKQILDYVKNNPDITNPAQIAKGVQQKYGTNTSRNYVMGALERNNIDFSSRHKDIFQEVKILDNIVKQNKKIINDPNLRGTTKRDLILQKFIKQTGKDPAVAADQLVSRFRKLGALYAKSPDALRFEKDLYKQIKPPSGYLNSKFHQNFIDLTNKAGQVSNITMAKLLGLPKKEIDLIQNTAAATQGLGDFKLAGDHTDIKALMKNFPKYKKNFTRIEYIKDNLNTFKSQYDKKVLGLFERAKLGEDVSQELSNLQNDFFKKTGYRLGGFETDAKGRVFIKPETERLPDLENPINTTLKKTMKNLELYAAPGSKPEKFKNPVDIKLLAAETPEERVQIFEDFAGTKAAKTSKYLRGLQKVPKIGKIATGVIGGAAGLTGLSTLAAADDQTDLLEKGNIDYGDPETWTMKVGEFIEKAPVLSGTIAAATPLLTKPGQAAYKKIGAQALKILPTPLSTVGLIGAFGVDPESSLDRATLGAELALAPELVKQSAKFGPTAQRILNLGLSPTMAMRAARFATPLGIATLVGEGGYQFYKALEDEKARIAAMSPEERQMFEEEQTAAAYMGEAEGFANGGRVGLEEGGPPDPSRRKFIKRGAGIMGALTALGTGAVKLAPKLAEEVKVISKTAEGIPAYLTHLINKVKSYGASKILGKPDSPEGFKQYDLGDYTVIEGPGYTRVNKSNYGGFGDEVGIRNEINMEIRKDPETGAIQYEEIEVYPDMDGKMRDVEEGVDDMFHEEMEKFARSDD